MREAILGVLAMGAGAVVAAALVDFVRQGDMTREDAANIVERIPAKDDREIFYTQIKSRKRVAKRRKIKHEWVEL